MVLMVLMVWEGLVTESTPATSSITSPPHRLHPLRIEKPYKYKGLEALELKTHIIKWFLWFLWFAKFQKHT